MIKHWLKVWRRGSLSTIQFVLTIVVGMGAATALLSMMLALGYQPLPFHAPEQLVAVWERTETGGTILALSGPDITDFRESTSNLFSSMGVLTPPKLWLLDPRGPMEVSSYYIQANVFRDLGIIPVLGRGVLPDDEPATNNEISPVWISYRLWHSRYGGNRSVIGQTVGIADDAEGLNEQRTQIVGVLPPDVKIPLPVAEDDADIWYLTEHNVAGRPRESDVFFGVGRLRSGVSVRQAEAALDTVAMQLGQHYRFDRHKHVVVQSIQEMAQAPARQTMGLLSLGVGLVFLVGCLNLAILMSAEGRQRRREIAIRTALGASRWRLWREAAAEKCVLTLLSLGLGVLFASALLHVLAQLLPAAGLGPPLLQPPPLNLIVLLGFAAFALAAALVWSALLVAAADVSGTSRGLAAVGSGLGYAGLGDSAPSAGRWRLILLATQIGTGVCLLAAAAMAAKTYATVSAANLGPAPRQTVLFSVNTRDNVILSDSQVADFNQQLLSRLERLPDTQTVAQADMFPPPGFPVSFTKQGDAAGTERAATEPVSVSLDYFRALGIPILFGREFDSTDIGHSQPVAIISMEMAERNWASPEEAVGSQIALGERSRYRIIGVAANFNGYWSESPTPVIYLPEAQSSNWCGDVIVRTAASPLAVAALAPQALAGMPVPVTISDVATLKTRWRATHTRPQARTVGMLLLALLGLGLAVQGVYAVAAGIVATRSHELAVRTALGAPRNRLVWSVTRELTISVTAGSAGGVIAALELQRFLERWLGPMTGWQAGPIAVAVVLLVMAAAAGCYIPARAAICTNPVDVLRQG